MILEVFSNLNDSMILLYNSATEDPKITLDFKPSQREASRPAAFQLPYKLWVDAHQRWTRSKPARSCPLRYFTQVLQPGQSRRAGLDLHQPH